MSIWTNGLQGNRLNSCGGSTLPEPASPFIPWMIHRPHRPVPRARFPMWTIWARLELSGTTVPLCPWSPARIPSLRNQQQKKQSTNTPVTWSDERRMPTELRKRSSRPNYEVCLRRHGTCTQAVGDGGKALCAVCVCRTKRPKEDPWKNTASSYA